MSDPAALEVPESMTPNINWKKNLFFIWIAQILSMAGFAAAIPFVPIHIRDTWNIRDERELGVWMAAFTFAGLLSYCIATPIWGILADRFGRKIMLLRAYYLNGILFPCMILAVSPAWLIVVRAIVSLFTGTIAASQTLVVTSTPEEHHGFALGTLTTSVWSGNLIGLALGGGLMHFFGFKVAILTCGALYLLSGVLCHIFIRENFVPPKPCEGKKCRGAWSGLSAAIWISFFIMFYVAIARKFDEPYVPLMIEKIHGPENTELHTSWICGLTALGGIFSGILLGKLCDRYTPQKVAVPALIVSSATMFLMGVAGNLGLYGAMRFVNSLAGSGLETGLLALLSKFTHVERRGAVFGLASSIRMSGILVSTFLSGAVVYAYGLRSVCYVAGGLFILCVPLFWLTAKFVRAPEEDTPTEESSSCTA